MAVKVFAFVTVQPGKNVAFEVAARACISASRGESGVLQYDLWHETSGASRYIFNELYTDEAAIADHMASEHFKAFGLAVQGLAAAPPEIFVAAPVDVAA
jgi:quinol monooxygenase YgiN